METLLNCYVFADNNLNNNDIWLAFISTVQSTIRLQFVSQTEIEQFREHEYLCDD